MTKECSCGLAVMNLHSRIDEIVQRTTSGQMQSDSAMDLLIRNANTIIQDDMPQIRIFCGVDIRFEEEAMRQVRDMIPNINRAGARRMIQDNITTSLQSIREILSECRKK